MIGNHVYCKVPGVRIPPSPPVIKDPSGPGIRSEVNAASGRLADSMAAAVNAGEPTQEPDILAT